MNNQIGVEARKKKRDEKTNRIKRFSEQLFHEAFESINSCPEQDEFELRWMRMLDVCVERLTSTDALKIAHDTLQSCVTRKGWKVFIPTFLHSRKLPAQMRTQKWHAQAWLIYDSYQRWRYEEETQTNSHMLFADMLISLIFESGQCDVNVILAFARQLKSNSLKIRTFYSQIYVTLELIDCELNTNVYRDGEAFTQYQCYIHPCTLGRLRHWDKTGSVKGLPDKSADILRCISLRLKETKRISKSLKQFSECSIYTIEQDRYLSQALAEYRVGRIQAYSLPAEIISRLETGVVNKCHVREFTSGFNIRGKGANTARVRRKCNDDNVVSQIRACLNTKEVDKKVSSLTVRKRLEALLDDNDVSLAAETLVKWLIIKSETCVPSSMTRYFSAVAQRWLYLNSAFELAELDSNDIADIYTDFISTMERPTSRRYFAKRLAEVHQVAVNHQSLALVSSTVFQTGRVTAHTCSAYVDEFLFEAMLKQIVCLRDISDVEKVALQVFCVVSFRAGLRISEVQKLRIMDVEDSPEGWIKVRNNKFGNNKSVHSTRKVPLFLLLTTKERKLVSGYIKLRRQLTKSKYSALFQIGYQNQLVSAHQISNCVSSMLRELSGISYLVFHHLRHSALSRLQLVLELGEDSTNLENLLPYSKEQVRKISAILFGKTKQHKYEELAKFAGHSNINVTFEHYLHLSDWISAYKIIDVTEKIKYQQASKFGMSKILYNRLRGNLSHLSVKQFNGYLLEEYRAKNNELGKVEDVAKPNDRELKNVSFEVCRVVLDMYSSGYTVDDLCREYNIAIETVNLWLDNARAIKALTTRAGVPRHFSRSRTNMLTPADICTEKERAFLSGLLNRFRTHYKTLKAHEQFDVRAQLRYILNNTCTSKSGVYFSCPKQLAKFINVLKFLLPPNLWRAKTLCIEHSTQKKQWRSSLNKLTVIVEKKGTKTGRAGKGAVRLELVCPQQGKEPEGNTAQIRASHLAQYLAHMIAIMKTNILEELTDEIK